MPLPLRRDFVTAKLDYAITDKNHIFYRFNLDNFNAQENVGGIRAKSDGESNLTNTQAHGVSDTWVISPTKVNTLGLSILPLQQHPRAIFGRAAAAASGFDHRPAHRRPAGNDREEV